MKDKSKQESEEREHTKYGKQEENGQVRDADGKVKKKKSQAIFYEEENNAKRR